MLKPHGAAYLSHQAFTGESHVAGARGGRSCLLCGVGAGGSLIQAVQHHVADDCRWENSGLPTAANKAEMLQMMDGFIKGYRLHALVIDVHALAVSGANVLTERTDHMDDPEGRRLMSFPLAGILQVRGGKIVRWSDYFDPRPLLPPGG